MAARLKAGEPAVVVLGHGYESMTGDRRPDRAFFAEEAGNDL
jgi:hypothetical protein